MSSDSLSPEAAILVRPSGPLRGTVKVGGAKNSVLKLMAASLLAPGQFTIRNVPAIADVMWMGELLEHMGVSVSRTDDVLTIEVPDQLTPEAP
ncbi:MAG: hypothetical protein AAEB43_05005, partial [Acidimicrobiales bacterium]